MKQNEKNNQKKFSLTTADMAVIALSTALITVCAWISIPTAVPFTLQTLAIFVSAGLFGMKRSSLSMAVYILLAAIGIPVLSGMKGGFDKLIGSTGGYILGFVIISLLVGYVSDKTDRKPIPMALAMLGGTLLCYAFGTAWFMLVYARTVGPVGLGTVLGWCVIPFIIPDCLKIICALFIIDRAGKTIKRF